MFFQKSVNDVKRTFHFFRHKNHEIMPQSAGRWTLSAKRVRTMLLVLLLIVNFSAVSAHAATCTVSPKSSISQIGNTGKYLMHLEGTPYQIGYAMGYYRPIDVVRLVHGDYVIKILNLIMPTLNTGYTPITAAGLDLLLRSSQVQSLLDSMATTVPTEYKKEMQGIVDGVNMALTNNKIKVITYYHVLLVNLFPSLQYMTTSNLLDPLLSAKFEACQGFVAFNNATYDGSTFMGRHFMWTDNPLHETTCLAEYVPMKGNRFVAVTSPGMVGVITGMNKAGIGCGQDFFRAKKNAGFPTGVGMWLLGRKIVQYSSSIAEAEALIRASNEGAPSFIIVGDAKGAGAVFEVYDHKVSPRYANWISPDANAPDAIETKDDLVVLTNHAFTPDMYPVDLHNESSIVRYNILTDLILGSYGTMTKKTGKQIIDYMHPPSPYQIGFDSDYGNDPTQTVKQHVVFMDLTRGKLWALFGHYNDPWVTYPLQ